MRLQFTKYLTLLLYAIWSLAFGVKAVSIGGDGYADPGDFVAVFHDRSAFDYLRSAIGLSDAELRVLTDLADEYREALQKLHASGTPDSQRDSSLKEEYDGKIANALSPEQLHRLKRIVWRRQGPIALLDKEVATRLGLTSEQLAQLAYIDAEIDDQYQAAINSLPRVTETYVTQLEDRFKNLKAEKMLKLLSPKQHREFKAMLNE